MRLFGPQASRQFPTDRNPSRVQLGNEDFAVGGGTTSTLADYTVPVGRAAVIGAAFADAVVTTALAAGQHARVRVRLTPNLLVDRFAGGASIVIAAAVGVRVQAVVPTIYMGAGDRIRVELVVDAGAGVVTWHGGVVGQEYDA